MDARFQNIISTVEPLPDSIYGPLYRCALTLKDGTYFPCAIIQSKRKIVDLAKRRIKQELEGKGLPWRIRPVWANRFQFCDRWQPH